jgi:hypothetical protein
VRLRTDGVLWRVDVCVRARRWPWFWLKRDRWNPCVIEGFHTVATRSEAIAREAYARIQGSEAARTRGYRTVEATGGAHRWRDGKPRPTSVTSRSAATGQGGVQTPALEK